MNMCSSDKRKPTLCRATHLGAAAFLEELKPQTLHSSCRRCIMFIGCLHWDVRVTGIPMFPGAFHLPVSIPVDSSSRC